MSANENRVFHDHLGNRIEYDGCSPISWRVSAYVFVVRDRTVLMVEPVWAPRWELPGGAVEPHETLLAGAARECWEETGFHFKPTVATPYYISESFFYIHDASSYHHSVIVVFEGTVETDPDPLWRRDPREICRVSWVELASLTPANTHAKQWTALQQAGLV